MAEERQGGRDIVPNIRQSIGVKQPDFYSFLKPGMRVSGHGRMHLVDVIAGDIAAVPVWRECVGLSGVLSRYGEKAASVVRDAGRHLRLDGSVAAAGGVARRHLTALLCATGVTAIAAPLLMINPVAGFSAVALAACISTAAVAIERQTSGRATASALVRGPVEVMEFEDAVVLRFAENGDVTDASDAARRVLKVAPGILCGTGLFERVHVADRVAYMCALDDVRRGKALSALELRLRMPSPAGPIEPDRFEHFRMDFCSGRDGTEPMALLRDNSEIVALREALSEARQKTDGVDLAKSQFLAAMSHELRTPLNAIIGFSDVLLHEVFGNMANVRQKEYARLIRDSGQHLVEVVNSVLDVSKVESGCYSIHPENFQFRDAVEMCSAMMSLQSQKKNIDLKVEIGPAVSEILADRRAVQQILINLLGNAVKFTREGGHIVLGAQRLGSRLHFWVSDTGIGIAEDDLARIGRPFTQIRNDYTRSQEGTGLGLSLVKGLVALHKGTMSIESAPGQGTKVSISLPILGPESIPEIVVRDTTLSMPEEVSHGPLRKTA